MKRFLAFVACAVAVVALFSARPATSYVSNYTSSGSTAFPDQWASTPRWNLNPSRNSNIGPGRDVADVMQSAFAAWTNAPGSAADASRGADSSATSAGFNSENLICFVCQGDFSKEAETLAVTITTTSTQAGTSDGRGGTTQFAGQILDSDILFNPSRNFGTEGSGDHDLQTVATHEIGHFFGLDHTGVVRAVMFPFSPALQRQLAYDDVAAISTKYPDGGQSNAFISGSVRLGGSPVFGAHVIAESVTGADPWGGAGIRKSPISTLTFPDGTYRIQGLPPDNYTVTAEPLDLPVVNRDVQDFGQAHGNRSVQTNFTTRWY